MFEATPPLINYNEKKGVFRTFEAILLPSLTTNKKKVFLACSRPPLINYNEKKGVL